MSLFTTAFKRQNRHQMTATCPWWRISSNQIVLVSIHFSQLATKIVESESWGSFFSFYDVLRLLVNYSFDFLCLEEEEEEIRFVKKCDVTCSLGLFGLCPVLWSYQARWNGINFWPVHSASYISSHFSMSILCISIGQPDSLAIKISEETNCPVNQKQEKSNVVSCHVDCRVAMTRLIMAQPRQMSTDRLDKVNNRRSGCHHNFDYLTIQLDWIAFLFGWTKILKNSQKKM